MRGHFWRHGHKVAFVLEGRLVLKPGCSLVAAVRMRLSQENQLELFSKLKVADITY